MTLSRQMFTIKFMPDKEKTKEENLDEIMQAVERLVADNEMFVLTLELPQVVEQEVTDMINAIDESESIFQTVQNLDLSTPHSVTMDGKPLYAEKESKDE